MDVVPGMISTLMIFGSSSLGVIRGVIMVQDTKNERMSSVFWTFIASILVGLLAVSVGAIAS